MSNEMDEYDKDCVESTLKHKSCPNCGLDLKEALDKARAEGEQSGLAKKKEQVRELIEEIDDYCALNSPMMETIKGHLIALVKENFADCVEKESG